MKIEKLIIRNFRIFNGTYEFDFSNRDLIIISGPNGNGKSTIFDSIQWCLTGTIPRYEGSNERQKFNYLMNENLFRDNRAHTLSVEVWFRGQSGELHKVRRIQTKTKERNFSSSKVEVDGKKLNKTLGIESIRNLFSSIGHEESKSTINLSTFFSATQLLSQDALENFIRLDKPNERYKLIDNILGVRKYGIDFEEFLDSVKTVAKEKREHLVIELEKPTKDFEKVSIQIDEKEKAIQDLGQLSEKEVLETINECIKEINETKEIELYKDFPLNEIDDKTIKSLVGHKSLITDKKRNLEKIKELLENVKDPIKFQYQDYIKQKEEAEKQYNAVKNKIEKRKKGKEIITTRKVLIETLKVRRDNYQNNKRSLEEVEQQIENKKEEVKNLLEHEEIKKIINDYSSINDFLDLYNQNLELCSLIQKSEQYSNLESSKNAIDDSILEQQKAVLIENTLLKQAEKDSGDIFSKIEMVNSQVAEKKETLVSQLVRQVQDHIVNTEDNNVCLVCGAEYVNSEILKQNILNQIEITNSSLSELEQVHLELISQYSLLSEEIRSIKSRISNIEKEIVKYMKESDDIILQKEVLLNSNLEIREFLKNNILTSFNKEEKLEFLNKFKLAYNLIKQLDKNKLELEDLSTKKEPIKEQLEVLKLESGKWQHYLELEESLILEHLQKLTRYLLKVAEEEVKLDQKLNESHQQIISLNSKWINREKQVTEIKEKLPNYIGDITETNELIEEHNGRVEQLKKLELNMEKQLTVLRGFLQENEILKLKNSQKSLKTSILNKNEILDSYSTFINEELELLKRKHIGVRGNLISEYLLQHSEYIDQLFMQISPHAIYRHVQLVPKEKNLYIVLSKESARENNLKKLDENELKQQFNASLKFSSAQSNVLAVCIFLALNRSQKWTNLNFLGIDDPFQNLDDINVFSFLDVLSQVIIMQNKQLFISTHNENFAHLLKAKMGLETDQVGSIVFSSYNENGVNIKGNCIKKNDFAL
ncbi:AAA family ATPase [Peribacillus simplex]